MSDKLTAKQTKALELLRAHPEGLTVVELGRKDRELANVMRRRLYSLRDRGLAQRDEQRPARWRAT